MKDELQTFIVNHISCNKISGGLFWLNEDGLNKLLTMNPMEKQITKMNTTSENTKYIFDNKTFMCQNKQFRPLKARRRKWISEPMYRYIEKSFSMIHRNTSLQGVETIYQIIN